MKMLADPANSSGSNLETETLSGSISISSQNISLPSSSSSVTVGDQLSASTTTAEAVGLSSSYNSGPMMESSSAGGISTSSSSLTPSSTDPRYSRRRRAPDMQLGRCPWIRVYDNVTYIVAGIIIRDSSTQQSLSSPEILLIQEAKKKCRGKWYIPAGHVEPGETIQAACQREVLEETGFECRVDGLICMETRGSGWYRMSFACTITGGKLKTEPDRESLAAGWHSIERVRRPRRSNQEPDPNFQLRCRDFFPVIDEALRWRDWRASVAFALRDDDNSNDGGDATAALASTLVDACTLEEESARALERVKHAPLLNRDEAQPGLFIEYVIVKHSSISEKIECLVHGSVRDQQQLLDDSIDAFPTVEFGFEFFFPMVVSKCYRHIFEDGHQAIDLPEALLAMWCLPAPVESVRHGLRLRILCRHKRAVAKAPLRAPQRYHWLALEDERVLAALRLLPGQFRPTLFML